jgi:integrase
MKDTRNLKELLDGRWELSIYLPKGCLIRRYRRVFGNYKLALKLRDTIKGAIADGSVNDLVKKLVYGRFDDDHTVKSFLPIFVEHIRSRGGREGYLRRIEVACGTPEEPAEILNLIGHIPIAQFTQLDLQRFIDARSKQPNKRHPDRPVSAKTVCIDVSIISSIMSVAVKRGLIKVNPCHGMDLPKYETATKWVPTTDQVESFLSYMNTKDRGMAAMAEFISETGLRISEAMKLTRSDLDLPHRSITIPAPRAKGRRERRIPLTDRAMSVLSRLPIRMDGYVFGSSYDGKPFTRVEDRWGRMARKAGLPRMDRHCLRHYRITEWLRNGIPPYQVQYLAGHSTYSTTEEYVHIVQHDLTDAVRRAEIRAGGKQEATVSAETQVSIKSTA